MQDNVEVRPVALGESERLSATITLAMSDDPIIRWGLPEANQYLNFYLPFVGAIGGNAAIERGTAFVIGNFFGAAICLPPGVSGDEDTIGELFVALIEEPHRSHCSALLEAVSECHPKEPHWYLPLVGIEPVYQRCGFGSVLMNHVIEVCNLDNVTTFLESTNPVSVPFYERHGFEVLEEIVVGSSPPIFPMLRKPR